MNMNESKTLLIYICSLYSKNDTKIAFSTARL